MRQKARPVRMPRPLARASHTRRESNTIRARRPLHSPSTEEAASFRPHDANLAAEELRERSRLCADAAAAVRAAGARSADAVGRACEVAWRCAATSSSGDALGSSARQRAGARRCEGRASLRKQRRCGAAANEAVEGSGEGVRRRQGSWSRGDLAERRCAARRAARRAASASAGQAQQQRSPPRWQAGTAAAPPSQRRTRLAVAVGGAEARTPRPARCAQPCICSPAAAASLCCAGCSARAQPGAP